MLTDFLQRKKNISFSYRKYLPFYIAYYITRMFLFFVTFRYENKTKKKTNYRLKSDHETARKRKQTKHNAVIDKIILDSNLNMFTYDFFAVRIMYSVHGCCFTISFQNSRVLLSECQNRSFSYFRFSRILL